MEDDILKELEGIVNAEGDAIKNENTERQFALIRHMGKQLSESKRPLDEGAYMLIARAYDKNSADFKVGEVFGLDSEECREQGDGARVQYMTKFGSIKELDTVASDALSIMKLHARHLPIGVFLRVFLGKSKTLDIFAQRTCVIVRRTSRFRDDCFVSGYDNDGFYQMQNKLSEEHLDLVKDCVGFLKIPEYLKEYQPKIYAQMIEHIQNEDGSHDE